MVLEAERSPRLGRETLGRRQRETCPSTLEEQQATPFSFLKRATASRLRGCKGVINPPCNDVITLMDAGPVEHFISTRASSFAASSLYATSSFPQTLLLLLMNAVPVSYDTWVRQEAASFEKIHLSLE